MDVPLTLRVLPAPVPLAVETRARGDVQMPVRFRERRPAPARARRGRRGLPLVEILHASGPDRVSAGHGVGAPVAREYWQCTTDDGRIVLLFRDAAADGGRDAWHLHGWWD